jgi:hypothetical protein
LHCNATIIVAAHCDEVLESNTRACDWVATAPVESKGIEAGGRKNEFHSKTRAWPNSKSRCYFLQLFG